VLRFTPEEYAKLQARLHGVNSKPLGVPVLDNADKPDKRRKYGNEVTHLDDMRFDSKAEAQRWQQLCWMQQAGEIEDLKHHVHFDLLPAQDVNGRKERPVRYEADFTYMKDGKLVVEDVKSGPTKTKEFILKRKMMLFFHKIEVIEVMAE